MSSFKKGLKLNIKEDGELISCAERLVQFPPTPPSALIGGYEDRCAGLFQFLYLPIVASSTLDQMKFIAATSFQIIPADTQYHTEVQLNFQKRRGHGIFSLLHPRFSGVLGEGLDLAARWSRDVITVEKVVLEQSNSRYELQGEYVLPGSRAGKETGKGNLLRRAMTGHLGSVISSMGR
ncbi:unnamed protein product [Lactuca saligna]|uniref:Uncharacterized protein n=1 Tax=Lactuca saligna TaxID=75948 RepID=A0AA36EL68_LACSI|nr:unnamed protein product [Lactuca saligna]